jgi:hypothetical protein
VIGRIYDIVENALWALLAAAVIYFSAFIFAIGTKRIFNYRRSMPAFGDKAHIARDRRNIRY